MKEKTMRKKITLGLACVMMMSALGGCGTAKSKYLLDVDYTDYVKLCDYKGVETDKVVYEITDEAVQKEIESLLYDYATYENITNRGVQEGDYVVIDYSSKMDGKDAEDYSAEEEEFSLGDGYFYPEAEKALEGMKVGDTKEVEVTLTEESAEEEDIGKKLQMNITLKSISEEILPEYNQKFVEEETDYDTIEEFEKSIRDDLEVEKKEEYESVSTEGILEYIVDNSTFDGYPQELYDQCEKYYDSSNESYAAMWGMELEEFMELMGIDEDAKKQDVELNVNYELVVGAIAQTEGIDCTEEEIDNFAKENYEELGYEDTEAFFKDYDREEIGSELIYQKVVQLLLEHAKFVEISEAEYLERVDLEEALYEEDESVDEEEAAESETSEEGKENKNTEENSSEEKNSDEKASEENSSEKTTEETSEK